MYLITYGGRTVIHDGSSEGPRRMPLKREAQGVDRHFDALGEELEDRSRNEYKRSRNENDTKDDRGAPP